jgi:hypothetical protein
LGRHCGEPAPQGERLLSGLRARALRPLLTTHPPEALRTYDDEAFGYLKRVIVTPAVYPSLVGFRHFNIQSTGQKSRFVYTLWHQRIAMF